MHTCERRAAKRYGDFGRGCHTVLVIIDDPTIRAVKKTIIRRMVFPEGGGIWKSRRLDNIGMIGTLPPTDPLPIPGRSPM